MAATQQRKQPFRTGTRQRFAFVNSVAATISSTLTPIELPRVGLLSRIIVQFRGTITTSATGTAADLGPWSLAARLRVNANIGAASIVDVSGYGGWMHQPLVEEIGYRPEYTGIFAGTGAGSPPAPNADVHVAPLVSGANTWVLTWVLPIGANTGREFDLGLVNLQSPETRVTVEITTGAGADFTTNFSTISGSFFVYYEYYEIPDPRQFALPPLALVRLLEEQQAVLGTGDTVYTVPRQGVLLNLAHRITLNGARSDLLDRFAIRFNKTDTVYNIDRQPMRVMERLRYAMLPVTGVYYWDLWHAAQDVSAGDTRDAIDAEELSTLESIPTVSSGATLGSNNNFLASVRRIIQLLQ
jgi:hypothetical protein